MQSWLDSITTWLHWFSRHFDRRGRDRWHGAQRSRSRCPWWCGVFCPALVSPSPHMTRSLSSPSRRWTHPASQSQRWTCLWSEQEKPAIQNICMWHMMTLHKHSMVLSCNKLKGFVQLYLKLQCYTFFRKCIYNMNSIYIFIPMVILANCNYISLSLIRCYIFYLLSCAFAKRSASWIIWHADFLVLWRFILKLLHIMKRITFLWSWGKWHIVAAYADSLDFVFKS